MNIKSRINIKSFLYRIFAVFIIVMVGLAALPVKLAYAAACTFTSNGSGNWSTLAWNRTGTGCSTYPGQTFAGDTVTISGGNAVTLNVSPSQTIGTITINGSTANNGTQPTLLNVGAGTLSAASIALNPSNNNLGSTNRRVEITISTGTVNVTGNITTPNVTNGTGTGVLFTGNGSVNIGGAFLGDADASFIPGTGTINYNGAVQTVSAYAYNNLIISGSGAKTMPAGTSVTGNLSIAPTGTATASIAAGQNLSVGTLRLGGLGRINGTWGGTGSGATYINTTYFAAMTGRLTVGTATRVAANVTTWPTATGITSGQSLASSTLSGGVSPIPGTFAFTAPATIPPVGTYSASVTFTPTDATSYTSVTGTVNVVVTAVVVGNTYYVNKDNLSCSDTLNNGLTPAAPFCTIFKGSAMANSAGNTVRVLAGTYAETVTPTGSGSAGNPITFSANPGVTVTGAPGYGFRVSGRSYITIDGFNVMGTSNVGISVATSDHIIISNNHVSLSGSPVNGSTRAGINFDATTNSTISGNTTDHNTTYGIYLSGASNGNTVSDNISFANAQQYIRNATGINVYASNNNTILHNITYANEDTGIQLYSNSTGNLVIGNLTYGNADHGIDLNTSPNNTIVGNTVQGNYTSGINVEGNSTGVTIANNIAVDNGINIVGSGQPGNIRVDATSIAGSTINYDIVFLTGVGTSQIQWNGTNYATLALFRAAFPAQEVNGLQANPLFVAPTAPAVRPNSGNGGLPAVNVGDYHIANTSPAIDSANSNATGEPLLDIEGNPRVDTPVANTGAGVRTYDDRGAYELQTGGALPVVTTEAVTAIGTTTASGNGTITNLGAPNPYQHGVVWDTAANPTIALATKTTQGTANATGAFTSAITGLTPGTLYHVRAYATNTAGTSYGADVSFAVTTTSVVTSVSPSVYGTPVTFTATVFPATATGTVTFFDGATVLGTGTLSAGVATLSTSTLSVSGSPHSITATLAGSGIYGSSTSSPISQTITPATLTYTANPASRIYGAANPAFSGTVTGFVAPDTQLTATTGTLSFTSTATTTSNVGSYAITGSGLTANNGNYTFVQAADNTTALTITPATPVVTWATPADITYGTALSATQLNASSSVAGTFAYTPASGTILNAGNGQTLSADFISTDPNYVNVLGTTVNINVLQATPVIIWETPADITYGTALGATQLNASTSVAGTFEYIPASGTILNAGNGQPLSVDFTSTDPNYKNVLGVTVSINVLQATPLITWATPADITYGTALSATQLNASTSVAGTFAYTPISGTILNAGNGQTLSADFTSTDPNYKNVLGITVSINVLQATPLITWAAPADITYGTALSATQLNASSSVAGTFVYTPASGTILNAVNGQTLSADFTSTDPNYKDVLGATVSINVLQATPVITWATPADITYGTALGATQLNASSPVAGTFEYTPASGTVLNAGNGQTLSVDFTSTDPNYKNVLGVTVSIDVLQATPLITWGTPADITYGTALSATQLNASTSVAGTFEYTPASGTILNVGNGQTLSADFTSTDPNYKNVLGVTVSINVLQATPLITWATPADITYGTALSATQLNASSPVAGTFAYTPASGTILNAGNGQTLSADFTSTDPNYKDVLGATVKINVLQATPPFITWPTPAGITYGTALSATQLNASTSVAGTFEYTPASGTVLNAGNGQTLSVDFTSTDPNYKNVLGITVSINVLQATPLITWAAPADITYGTALSATQLNASTSVAGTFAYTPVSGTILNAGNGQTLSADFTSTDPNYKNVLGATVSINVLQATPLITWATPADITYGTALSATQLNASSSVAGTFAYTPASGTILNAGNGQTLSADFTSTDPNYENMLGNTVSINVIPASLTITASNATMAFGGTVPTITPSYSGLQAGDTAPATVPTCSTTATNTSPVGSYPSTCTGAADANYNISYAPGSVSVTPEAGIVVLGDLAQTYDGTPKSATVTTTPPNLSINVTYGGLATVPTNAGSYTVVATITDANYSGSASDTLIISPATVTPGITASNKIYDGTITASFTCALTGVIGLDDVNCTGGTASFADLNVGTWTVTAAGLGLSGADSANYELSSTSAANTADITQRTLNVTAAGVNKIYDGTTAATVTLADDRVIGDAVTTAYTTASFVDPNIGTGITVNVSGISITGGANSGNYALGNTTTTTTANITNASQTITVVTSAPASASNTSNFDVKATASSGLPVTITTSGSCSGGGTNGTATITMTSGSGTCSVFYDQDGVPNYSAAPQIQENVTATEGPVFTSADKTSFDVGFLGNFNITAAGNPSTMTISVSGTLPAGVSFTNNGDGTADFVGTPVLGAQGTYNLILTANNGVAPNATQNFTLTVRNGPVVAPAGINSIPDTGNGSVSENEAVIDTLGITKISVEFSRDVYNPANDTDVKDVTNPANYLLVRSSSSVFQTASCDAGPVAPDVTIAVDSVTYSNGDGSGPFISTLSINGSFPLNVVGFYRLYVCGTTSIVDATNTDLILAGDGTTPGTDFQRNFHIMSQISDNGDNGGGKNKGNTAATLGTSGLLIPVTGFAPDQVTILPVQPVEKSYKPLNEIRIEIPTLGINFPIVGVALNKNSWDLTWLQNSVGYLEGSAYPTWSGNTVLSAHVLDAYKNLGPFSDIKGMQLGQKVYIHFNKQVYVYQVQENKKILPSNISAVFKHEEDSWVTLVTCEDFNAKTGLYTTRRLVRAVLISVITEK